MAAHRATVTRNDAEGIFVEIPSLGAGMEFGPCGAPVSVGGFTVGDRVIVTSIDGIPDDLEIIGRLTDGTAPDLSIGIDNLTDVTITSGADKQILQLQSGVWVNKSDVDLNGKVTLTLSGSTSTAFAARASGDTQDRIVIDASGKTLLGSGSVTGDTNLYRSAADTLTTDDAFTALRFVSTRSLAGSASYESLVSGDTNSRLIISADGKHTWGSGSTTGDTNLYRAGANFLGTDDTLQVTRSSTSDLYIGGLVSGDTQYRWQVFGSGTQRWGPGNAAQDAFLSRSFSGSVAGLMVESTLLVQGSGATDPAISLRSYSVPDSVDRLQIDVSGKHTWGSGSGAVDTNLYRSTADTLKTDDSFIVGTDLTVLGDASNVLPAFAGVSAIAVTSGTDTTASGSYVNMAGSGSQTSISFTKKFGSAKSKVVIFMSGTFFTAGTFTGGVFGAHINGSDVDVARVSAAMSVNVHQTFSGFAAVASLAAGTYTIQGRWHCDSGSDTLTRNTADWLSLSAIEVAA